MAIRNLNLTSLFVSVIPFGTTAYMAVTNLVKDQTDDHAKRIAEFAIDAIEAANETIIDPDDETKGCVNIRVGKGNMIEERGH